MKIDKKKLFMIVSISVLVVTILVCAGTYAWYVWNTSDTEKVTIATSVGAATIYYDSGSSITDARLRPVSVKENGIVKQVQIKSSVTGQQKFNLYLDINSIDPDLQHESFRFAFYKGSETTPKVQGNFSSEYLNAEGNTDGCTVNTGVRHIELLTEEAISTSITTYTLYIWIDGANYTNPNEMQNKNFTFTLHASGEDAIIKEGKIPDITTTVENSLAYQLVSTYNAADKVDTPNNSVIYHYDRTNRLMSDVAGNLRFFGADDTTVSDDLKNYIYFNCDNYSSQSEDTCELWRIIGVFDGKVKIMRNSVLNENLSWDQDKNHGLGATTYNNNWSNSSLQEFLNGKYYDRGEVESWTYYNGSSGSSSVSVNLKDQGITSATREANLISETLWYLKGWNSASIYSDQMYDYERNSGKVNITGQPTTMLGNIAVPYVSDYGYAVDFGSCVSKPLDSYNDATCTSTNWMKSILGTSNYGWLMAPNSSIYGYAWRVRWSGNVIDNFVYSSIGVAPVLHLNSELGIESGDGSQDSPYKLAVN